MILTSDINLYEAIPVLFLYIFLC